MTIPDVWGPPIWKFFHTLAENCKEKQFPFLKLQMFVLIKNICFIIKKSLILF